MGKIYFIDVTNRDGVQTARLGLSKLEKTMINMYLNEMGVFQSEFGFPTTRHESYYLQANLELAEMGVLKPIRLGGWIRAVAEDVEKAFEYVPNIKHLNLSISTSDQMIYGKFLGKKTREDIIKMMTEAVDAARAHGAESIEAAAVGAVALVFEFQLVRRAECLADQPVDVVGAAGGKGVANFDQVEGDAALVSAGQANGDEIVFEAARMMRARELKPVAAAARAKPRPQRQDGQTFAQEDQRADVEGQSRAQRKGDRKQHQVAFG